MIRDLLLFDRWARVAFARGTGIPSKWGPIRSRFDQFSNIMTECVFQLECWFEGRVQGVGFRVQTLAVARGFEVSGTVQNLVDGRVYVLAEGEEREVRDFIKELQLEMEPYIRKAETKAGGGPRRAKGFTIAH